MQSSGPLILLAEEDGVPDNLAVYKIKFPNSSLTDNGDGTASVSIAAFLVDYAKLDGSNQPFTGNIEIRKSSPDLLLRDSSSMTTLDITVSSSSANFSFSNGILDGDTLTWSPTLLSFSATLSGGTLQATVSTGQIPIIITSTTKCTNLNADRVDGADVGTSGATIPLLNATNTWSGSQTFSTDIGFSAGVDILPAVDNTCDLGTSLKRFNNIFMGGSLGDGIKSITVTNIAGLNLANVFTLNQTISKATPKLIFTDSAGDDWEISVTTGVLAIRNTTDSIDWVSVASTGGITFNAGADNTYTLTDAENFVCGSSTGNSLGTSTSQKISVYGITPVVQGGATTDLGVILSNFGIRASGTAYPITTSGSVTLGSLTAGRVVFSGTSGLLSDDSDFTFSTDTLTVTKIAATIHTGDLTFSDTINIILNTSTGTKIGTATTQKIGFFNATPVVQQIATSDLGVVLSALGLRAAGTAYPITTSGSITLGSLTSGRVPFASTAGLLVDDSDFTFATDTLTVTKIAATTFTGNITISTKDIVTDTTTGTKLATGATQKLGFWNATPVVQSTGWSVSNETTDKSYDADSTTIDELADVLGTLIETLKTYGILGA